MNKDLAVFEGHEIRRVYDEKTETWWFSVVDIIQVLTQQPDFQTARKYWNKLKERLTKEGSQSVTNCHRLKMPAADGKRYLTDAELAAILRYPARIAGLEYERDPDSGRGLDEQLAADAAGPDGLARLARGLEALHRRCCVHRVRCWHRTHRQSCLNQNWFWMKMWNVTACIPEITGRASCQIVGRNTPQKRHAHFKNVLSHTCNCCDADSADG
jgi:hypothetical protein